MTSNANAPHQNLEDRTYLTYKIQQCGETNKMYFCCAPLVETKNNWLSDAFSSHTWFGPKKKKKKSNLSLKLCINFNYVTKSTFLFRLLIFPTTKLAQKIWKKSYGSAHNCTYPYVLFLVYWVVGIQVNHLWCSVCWSRVSSDLRDKQRIRERNDL